MTTPSAPHARLARFALIAVPAIAAASQIRGMVVSSLFRRTIEEMTGGGLPHEEVRARLELIGQIGFGSHLAFVVMLVVAAVLLATSLTRATLAWASVGASVAYLGLAVVERFLEFGREIPLWVKGLWFFDDVLLQSAIVLAIVAAARQRDGARLGAPSTAAIAIGGASLAASAFYVLAQAGTSASDVVGWLMRFLFFVLLAGQVGCAWSVARSLDADPAVTEPRRSLDGTPLRALGFALLARVALGLLLQLAITTTAQSSPSEAGGLAIAASGVNGAISLVVLFALVAYLRYPPSHRSEALPAVIVLLVLSVALDVVAASATSSLLDGVAQAKAATSMWGSPSLSDMERHLATLAWCGGGALVFGVVAAVVLAGSLRRTAVAVDDARSADRAGLVRLFVVLAGAAAIVLVIVASSRSGASSVALAVVGLALLVFALFLLVTWLQLLFGLARSVEAHRPNEPHGAADAGALS